MNKRNLLILIRYFSLLILVIYSINYSYDLPFTVIVILLSIIIINQFRFFNLRKKELLVIISISLELSLLVLLSYYTKSFSIFYFIPLVLDVSLFLSKNNKYILLLFLIITSFILNIDKSFFASIESSSLLFIISIFCIYIYNEDISKLNYQNLYDQLRISEDRLKRANIDLEVYASSVEEIAILKERNRISREIHDSVGHSLSTTIIQLGAIERLLTNNELLKDLVHELREFVKESFQEVRDAVSALKPSEYENYQNLFKVEELIKNFIKLTNVDVKLTISKNTWPLSSVQSITLYRIIQESLSNSLRHGKATKINIFITFNIDHLIITISDNGKGCTIIKKGNGINSISERINELNGQVEFNSSNEGFIIRASFPKTKGGVFIE